jgi:hypothetical protein
MRIDVVVTPAIILAVAVLAIFAMIVYYWIRTTYGQCTSDPTENQSRCFSIYINVTENWKDNQEWTIQRNWQDRVHKTEAKNISHYRHICLLQFHTSDYTQKCRLLLISDTLYIVELRRYETVSCVFNAARHPIRCSVVSTSTDIK